MHKSLSCLVGEAFAVNGAVYRLRLAQPPNEEEMKTIKARQEVRPHDRGVNYTDPLTCAICGKEMNA